MKEAGTKVHILRFHFYEVSKRGKSRERVSSLGLGVTAHGTGPLFGGDVHVLKLTVAIVAQLCDYPNNHGLVHFKWMDRMVCEIES